MKITSNKLRHIIREELSRLMREQQEEPDDPGQCVSETLQLEQAFPQRGEGQHINNVDSWPELADPPFSRETSDHRDIKARFLQANSDFIGSAKWVKKMRQYLPPLEYLAIYPRGETGFSWSDLVLDGTGLSWPVYRNGQRVFDDAHISKPNILMKSEDLKQLSESKANFETRMLYTDWGC